VTIERPLRILNENGVHARPAAELVKVAARFASDITVSRDDLTVNGKSIMGVMMLAAECGATITVRATGDDAEAAVDAIAALVADRFGERA
jgi:phosphocarrier protein HPr